MNTPSESDVTEATWVWRSSSESRSLGKVSLLAVSETLICIGAYWFSMALGYSYVNHFLLILAVPLVVLRSENSIKLGAHKFDRFFSAFYSGRLRKADSKLAAITAAVVVILPGAISFIVVSKFDAIEELNFFVRSPIQLAIVLNVVLLAFLLYLPSPEESNGATDQGEPRRKTYQTMLVASAVIFAPAYVAAILLRALYARVISVVRHPIEGIKASPKNWRELVLCTDSFQPPELVPGHLQSQYGEFFSVGRSERRNVALEDEILIRLSTPLLFLPAIIWRYSIKSTAWFYLSILILGRGWLRLDASELLIWNATYTKVLWNWVGLITSVTLLVASLSPLVGWDHLVRLARDVHDAGAPNSPFLMVMVLDWSKLASQPWYWFYLPGRILSVYIFFASDANAKQISSSSPNRNQLKELKWLMWTSNVRFVLVNTGFVVALFYLLAALCRMDNECKGLFTIIFGQIIPDLGNLQT